MNAILNTIVTWIIFILAAPCFAQIEQSTFSKTELEQLVAPIALYPDPLLAQVLIASTYPLEIASAAVWIKSHPDLEGKALEKALQQQPWDPSVKSLTALPDLLTMMNEKLDMTQKLGDAILSQQKDVLNAVQTLRVRAQGHGNLNSSQEQTINKEVQNVTPIVTIEPTDSEIIYVPTYDPHFVYGTWPNHNYPPYYFYPPTYISGTTLLSFDVGTAIGHALWGNCNWHNNTINLDVKRYNKFNNTNINNINWQHNAEHRRGVPYRNDLLQQKYAGNQLRGTKFREAFRGFQQKPSPITKTDVTKQPDSMIHHPSILQGQVRPQVSQQIQRPSAFDDINHAALTRIFSHRGAFSRGSMSRAGFERNISRR